MTCALCRQAEADKKNTHYLTDGIIKNCLNQDGGGKSKTGLYFDVSSNKLFTEFNFQRETSVGRIEEVLGRTSTKEENERAKQNAFSVDNVFCTKCEDIFTKIEDKFINEYRHKFRDADLTNITELSFDDTTTIRLFFLLQIWRTAICAPQFKISAASKEGLRKLIRKPDQSILKTFPLSITYLTTRGEDIEYTTNRVGYAIGSNPSIIFMCDFLIQFYESMNELSFLPLYGTNKRDNYKKYVNFKESAFLFKIISNEERKDIINNMAVEKCDRTLNTLSKDFQNQFQRTYDIFPSASIVNSYLKGFVDWDDIPLGEQLTEQRVMAYTDQFFQNIR